MSNSLVADFRSRFPDDPRSDAELTLAFGQAHEQDGRYAQFPDFVQDYQALKQTRREALAPSLGEEFRRGVASGTEGMAATVASAGALMSDTVAKYGNYGPPGLNRLYSLLPDSAHKAVRNYLLDKAKSFEDDAAENAPTIPTLRDIKTPADAIRYGTYGAGQVVPSLVEAGVTAGAGALIGAGAGTVAEPGGGTAVGAVGGGIAGFFEKQAVKSLIKKGIANFTREQLATETKALGMRYGQHIATALNSYALSSGEIYNDLATDKNVDPDKALNVSLLGGLAAAWPDTLLPSYVASKFIRGVEGETAKAAKKGFYGYLTRFIGDAAKEVPMEAGTESFQEWVDIAAKRYALGKPITAPLSQEEKDRIANAGVFGGIGGLIAAPVSAIPSHGHQDVINSYTGNPKPEVQAQVEDLAKKAAAGDLVAQAAMNQLPPDQRNAAVLAKDNLARAETAQSDDIEEAVGKPGEVSQNGQEEKEQEVLNDLSVPGPAVQDDKTGTAVQAPAETATQSTPGPTPEQEKLQKARELMSQVEDAASEVNPNPTEAQKESGTYKKGHVSIHGMDVTLENAKGSERSGVDENGKPWSVEMPAHYGYIKGTEGKDGDHVDVYVGPNPASQTVYVVDQVNDKTGAFDEHKPLMGFDSEAQALAAYDAAFSDRKGPLRRGAVTQMPVAAFKAWVQNGDTKKPLGNLPERTQTVTNAPEAPAPAPAGSVAPVAAPQPVAVAQEAGPKIVERSKPSDATTLANQAFDRVNNMSGADLTKELKRMGLSKQFPNIDIRGENAVKAEKELTQSEYATRLRAIGAIMNKTFGDHGKLEEHAGLVTPEMIDFEPEQPANGKQLEPGFFSIPEDQQNTPEMAEKLVSGARGLKKDADGNPTPVQKSRRMVSILDNETGKVYLASIFKNKDVRVTDPAKVSGEIVEKGGGVATELSDLLARKQKDGSPRYRLLDSARLNVLKHFALQEFENEQQYREHFGDRAQNIAKTLKPEEVVNPEPEVPNEQPTHHVETGDELEHFSEAADEVTPFDEMVNKEEAGQPEPSSFTADHANAVYQVFGIGRLTPGRTKILFEQRALSKRAVTDAIKGPTQELMRLGVADPVAAVEIVKRLIYESLRDNSQSKQESVQSLVQAFGGASIRRAADSYSKARAETTTSTKGENANSQNTPGANSAPAATATTEGQGSPAQEGPANGRGGNANPADTRLSLPAGDSRLRELAAPAFQQVRAALQRAGIPVALHQQVADALVKSFLRSGQVTGEVEGGMYDRAARAVQLVLRDAQNPSQLDLRTLFDEAAHALFDRETPARQQAILQSVGQALDNSIGLSEQGARDIASAQPGAATHVLAEERLARAVADNLQQKGFNPAEALGIGQRIVRFIKDFYYRSLMTLQKALLGQEHNSPALITKYFQNRLESFLSGQDMERGFVRQLVGEVPSKSTQGSWLGAVERMGENGIEHDALPLDSLDNVRFSIPSDPLLDHSRKTDVEKLVAPINHQISMLNEGAALPGIEQIAKERKVTPAELILKTLRMDDPNISKAALADAKEANGQPVQFDKDKTIEGFNHPAQQGSVREHAAITVQSNISKIGKVQAKSLAEIDEFNQLKAEKATALQAAKENYLSFQFQNKQTLDGKREIGRKLFRSISGFSKRAGILEQQLRQLDPRAVIKDYAPAFQKLFTGDLGNESLMSILETAASDPNIDFTDNIVDVREAMAENPEKYEKLLGTDKDSLALLATVVAFAKTNQTVMTSLELRALKNGVERQKIADSLEEVGKEKKSYLTNLRELARSAKLEERYRAAYREKLQEVRSVDRRILRAQTDSKVASLVAPIYLREQAKLSEKLSMGAGFTFGDGAVYNAPDNPEATDAEVVASKKTLALDTSTGKVTSRQELESELLKMKAFLMEREKRAAAGDQTAKGYVYQAVKRQFHEIANHKNFKLNLGPAQRFMFEHVFLPVGRKVMDAFGTPAAQSVFKRFNRFTTEAYAMRNNLEKIGNRNDRMEDDLIKLLPSLKVNQRLWLRENVLNPAKRVLQSQHDLEEQLFNEPERLRNAVFNRVHLMLQRNADTNSHLKQSKTDMTKFMPLLRKLLDFQEEANGYLMSRIKSAGIGVLDPKLKVMNPATGQMEDAIREHLPQGAYTFAQKLYRDFYLAHRATTKSGWGLAQDLLGMTAQAYNENPEQARKIWNTLFNNPEHGTNLQQFFFRPLVESETESRFDAPPLKDGVSTVPADLTKTLEAYDQSKGDPIAFAEALYDSHGGTTDKGDYVQSVIGTMVRYYSEMKSIMDKLGSPDASERHMSIRGMVANTMIDARRINHMPSSWFTFHDFDHRDMVSMGERVAAEIAFGRDQGGLANDLKTIGEEVKAAKDKLDDTRALVQIENPNARPKEFEKALRAKLGDTEYKRLTAYERNAPQLDTAIKEIAEHFRKDNNPDANFKVFTRAAQALSGLLVNQPSSAIAQMAALTDLMLRYGASGGMLKATAQTVATGGKELAASLAQSVGIQMFNDGEEHKRYIENGLGDPGVTHTFKGAFTRQEGESGTAHFFRGLREAMGFGINPLGDKAQHTVIRPLQPFVTSAILANKSLTETVWKIANNWVARGLDFYKANPNALADPTHKLSKESLRLKGFEGDSFTRLTEDMDRWGMDYDDMVRGAMQGGSLSNEDAQKLYAMMLSEVSSESNLSTMPMAAYNNSIIRFAAPLLGWSFRRANQIAALRLDPQGQLSMKALGYGLTGLAMVGFANLGLAAVVDDYYDKLLAKKRNLRPMTSPAGIIENLNRIGTLGMFGEGLNTLIGSGAGGDNRMLSVDQRVVALSSLQSLIRSVQSFANQDFDADYVHVIRPLAQAVGAGGLMQYMQLANNALGLDNAESRATARLNASNWLRVVGRDLDLEVRPGGGGYNTPTPLTPWLTRMELAAYANDAGDFSEAYRGALEEAAKSGKPDPKDYVKRAFETRNPLRSVFKTAPTAGEYTRILGELPEAGARDVSEAVRLINTYGAQIGVKPFDGREEKAKAARTAGSSTTRSRLTLDQARRLTAF